jgi:HD-like signal output (HDOD) protein
MKAIVVDANFTDLQGLDFIAEVNADSHLPVLIITPPDDPHCAIEALRIGVFNYLVKTDRIYSVLETALVEATEKFNDDDELKRVIIAQKQRAAELERELARLKQPASTSGPAHPDASADNNRRLFATIDGRLRKGEVNLPSYPESSMKLARLMRDQAGIGPVARMLEGDVAIAAKLIGISNSARYRGLKANSTAEQAISVLGLSTTKNYVDLIANRALYVVRNPRYLPILRELWEHSVACAHASKAVADLARIEASDEVFSMGMLHDIGKLLLTQVIAEMEAENPSMKPLEDDELMNFLQAHHGHFGRKLLEIWKLPATHADAAQYHESLEAAPAVTRELFAVHLGNLLAKKIGYGHFSQETWDAEAAGSAAHLKIDLQKLVSVEKDLLAHMKENNLPLD